MIQLSNTSLAGYCNSVFLNSIQRTGLVPVNSGWILRRQYQQMQNYLPLDSNEKTYSQPEKLSNAYSPPHFK